jgi:hypothetical protein
MKNFKRKMLSAALGLFTAIFSHATSNAEKLEDFSVSLSESDKNSNLQIDESKKIKKARDSRKQKLPFWFMPVGGVGIITTVLFLMHHYAGNKNKTIISAAGDIDSDDCPEALAIKEINHTRNDFTTLAGELRTVLDEPTKQGAELLAESKEQAKWMANYYKSWKQTVRLPDIETIFLSDLHANLSRTKVVFENVVSVLQKGKNVQIVGLGDYIDRGEQPLEVLSLLTKAQKVLSSRLVLTSGNHETDGVCPHEFSEFKGPGNAGDKKN